MNPLEQLFGNNSLSDFDVALSFISSNNSLILLIAVVIEMAMPIPENWSLTRCSPLFRALAHRVNRPENTSAQSYFAGFMLPALIIVSALGMLLMLRWLEGFDSLMGLILLPLLLESRICAAPVAKVKYFLLESNKEAARGLLQGYMLRDCQKLSVMGTSKACCEFAAMRMMTSWFAIMVWYMIAGLEGALIMQLVSTLSRLYSTKIKEYQSFGASTFRLEQGLLLPPVIALTICMFILSLSVSTLKMAMHGAVTFPAKCTGFVLGMVGCSLGISLGGPRYYEGELFRYPRVGGNLFPNPDSPVLVYKQMRLWGFVFIILAVAVEVFFKWV